MDTNADAITEHLQPLLKPNERIEQLWPLHGDQWLAVTDRNILTITLTETNDIQTINSYPSGTIQKLSVTNSPEPTTPYYTASGACFIMGTITALLATLTTTSLYLGLFAGAALLIATAIGALIQSQRLPTNDITQVTITLEYNETRTFKILGNQTPEVLKSRLRQTY